MAKQLATLKILVISEATGDVEGIINILRNAGYAVRPKRVETKNEFQLSLDKQPWDICLCSDQIEELPAFTAIDCITEREKDIPTIILTSTYAQEQVNQGLKKGAIAVIPEDETDQILYVINNEMKNLTIRRQFKQLELDVRESEKRCRLLLESSREAIAYEHEGMFIYTNPSYNMLFGYNITDELLGTPLLDTIATIDHKSFKQYLKSYHQGKSNSEVFTCHGKRMDGSEFSAELAMSPATYHNEPCTQLIVRLKDSQQELDAKIQSLSTQDLLTGLCNRGYLTQVLDEQIAITASTGKTATLMYIEIDDFSSIKETVGLGGSDLILGDIAELLQSIVVEEQMLLARYSDDVFSVLMPETRVEESQNIAQKIYQAINEHSSVVSGKTINTQCNIGITAITETAPGNQEIFARTHAACQQARLLEQPRIQHYKPGHQDSESTELDSKICQAIQLALEQGNFSLAYQPIISLHGESKEYFEVLIRMKDHNQQEIAPKEFFPTATQAGLLAKIDRWVILHATKVLSAHRLEGHHTYLFVKLSSASLLDNTLLPWISVALKTARLPSDALIFELHEGDVATHLKHAKVFTQGLKELHCKVSISHFGSGLDSFNTLKNLHVDYIKLDGSYTHELISGNKNAQKELTGLIQSLQGQGKLTIAPMVEDAHILPLMWQCGINYIQGYYLSPPLPNLHYNFEGHFEELG